MDVIFSQKKNVLNFYLLSRIKHYVYVKLIIVKQAEKLKSCERRSEVDRLDGQ